MSDNISTDLFQDHYTQVQVYLAIIANKGLDCLSVRTEIIDNKAYTSIIMSVENFAIFTKNKDVVIRPSFITHELVSKVNETCTQTNHISLLCHLDTDNLALTTKMNGKMVNAILEDTSFGFDSKIFFKGE